MSEPPAPSGDLSARRRKHWDEVVEGYRLWFSNTPTRPTYKGFLLIEYKLPSSALYYYANGEIVRHYLTLPLALQRRKDELRGHVGEENWKRWEALVADSNSHLDRVVELWGEIGSKIGEAARRAGLVPWSGPNYDFGDLYWPEQFVASIWNEDERFTEKKLHSWDAVKIVEETIQLPMGNLRHSAETIHAYVFESSDMVRSQSLEPLKAFIEDWKMTAATATPKIEALSIARARIDATAQDLQAKLRGLAEGYTRSSKLEGSCPSCPR